MYLGRMGRLGMAITMPPLRAGTPIRTSTPIRTVTPAPIPSVNQPVVSTPSAAAVSDIMWPVLRLPPWTQPPSLPARPQPTPTPLPVAPPPTPINTNAGTPVPAGYPTSQLFVNTDGSFWQYSPTQSNWVNVGTPYNTGAMATPAAPPPSSSGASTAVPVATTAPAPVDVSVAPAASSYQEILDWLQQDTLLSSIGFAGIPNWIAAFGGALLLYKVSSGSSGGRR